MTTELLQTSLDTTFDSKDTTTGTFSDSNSNSTTDEGEEDAEYFSSLFQLQDGNWSVQDHFLTAEFRASVLDLMQPHAHHLEDGDNKVEGEEEDDDEDRLVPLRDTAAIDAGYFYLEDYLPLEEKGTELYPLLQCRGLAMASILLRCMAADMAPPYVKIHRLANEQSTRDQIMALKKQANEAFFVRDYPQALQLYEKALALFPSSYISGVVPSRDLIEIVNILSRQADCYFHLEDFWTVGQMASYALVFDGNHSKSRLLRAKAGLALARILQDSHDNSGEEQTETTTTTHTDDDQSLRYTLQAKLDLEEVLSLVAEAAVTDTIARLEQKTAQELMDDVVVPLLQREERIFQQHRGDGDDNNDNGEDWEFYLRTIMASCWRASVAAP